MSALYVGHIPASALPHFPDDGEPMHPEGLDVKLDVWDDGTHEVAVRDMDSRRWGVPVVLALEEPIRPALTAAELVEQVKAEAEAERLARLEAGLSRWGSVTYRAEDWKPGDVAMVTVTSDPSPVLAFRDGDPSCFGWSLSERRAGAVWVDHGAITDARRLVVINPDSSEDRERLADVMAAHPRDLQAALREFANPKPPKPEEPTGLGAVVEDAAGQRWLAVGGPQEYADEWYSPDLNTRARWGEIPVVRVLSEGVPS